MLDWNTRSVLVGRVISCEEGYRAFAPSPLPPDLVFPEFEGPLEQAKLALERFSLEYEGVPGQVIVQRLQALPAGSLSLSADRETAGMKCEPWRGAARELANCFTALDLIRNSESCLDGPTLCALHAALLSGGPASVARFAQPGTLRADIGILVDDNEEPALVYAPPSLLPELLADLAEFEKAACASSYDAVLLAALVHQQLTAIHPFCDGNGRVARLVAEKVLLRSVPRANRFPLSFVAQANRARYCRLQADIITKRAWPAWIAFFCSMIVLQCQRLSIQ